MRSATAARLQSPAMVLNAIWVAFILVGFAVALVKLFQGDVLVFSKILTGLFDTAKTGFDISLGLVGVMSLWLGIMKIGERAGMIALFARALDPLFRRVFPDIPRGHPASGSMVMNFSANLLGLDNAATPLGLKAMKELQELNPDKAVASNPMIMFLVLNTAGVTLIPTSVIAIRQSMAASQGLAGFNAADIFLPTLIATFVSFCAGLIVVARLQRLSLLNLPMAVFFLGFGGLMAGLYAWLSGLPADEMARTIGLVGSLVIVGIIALFVAVGALRRINVYEAFVDGAKDGFQVAITIIPYLIAILVAISVFRTTGGMEYLVNAIGSAVAGARPAHRVGGRAAGGPDAPALGQRRARADGGRDDDLRRRLLPGHPGLHHSRQHRDHLLRAGGLLRQRQHQEHALRAGLRPVRRPGGAGGGGADCVCVFWVRLA
jgi:spore maturation protein SpmA